VYYTGLKALMLLQTYISAG